MDKKYYALEGIKVCLGRHAECSSHATKYHSPRASARAAAEATGKETTLWQRSVQFQPYQQKGYQKQQQDHCPHTANRSQTAGHPERYRGQGGSWQRTKIGPWTKNTTPLRASGYAWAGTRSAETLQENITARGPKQKRRRKPQGEKREWGSGASNCRRLKRKRNQKRREDQPPNTANREQTAGRPARHRGQTERKQQTETTPWTKNVTI